MDAGSDHDRHRHFVAASRVNRSTDGEPDAKRQKVRKGTRSCWECRRRKMKCVFGSAADEVCISCHRRGAKCVAQELPEEISDPLKRNLQLGDRVVRVERLIEQLLEKAEAGGQSILPVPTSCCEDTDTTAQTKPTERTTTSDSGRPTTGFPARLSNSHERISQALRDCLPSPEDLIVLSKARGDISNRFFQILTIPYGSLGQSNDAKASSTGIFPRPNPGAHPVLLARHMLQVASFLQHLHPDFHDEIRGLSESPGQLRKRLVESAASLITTNDDLVGSIEGLECLMMESMYHTNCGSLRKGLISIRRAIVIAQLMGLHRAASSGGAAVPGQTISPDTRSFPQFIWFKIVYFERQLCLMLGIPSSTSSSADHSITSAKLAACVTDDSPMGRLERVHCVVAARILDRNQSEPEAHDFSLTQEIDKELQRATRELPGKWWLTVNLTSAKGDPEELFWDMRRLFHQLFHYHLLNQLHLPYLLLGSSCRSSSSRYKDDYSRITCVNAAREVLSRFIKFRKFSRIAYSCRTIDFFSLVAAMTLLLAHIDGHRNQKAASATKHGHGRQSTAETFNFVAHQRPSDRAMVEQVLDGMEEVSRMNKDALSSQSAELLRQLLAIEDEAEGSESSSHSEGRRGHEACSTMQISIPYFGAVSITRDGVISKDDHRKPRTQDAADRLRSRGITRAVHSDVSRSQTDEDISGYGSITWSSHTTSTGIIGARNSVTGESFPTESRLEKSSTQTATRQQNDVHSAEPYQSLNITPEELITQSEYSWPSMTAGAEDWAFQGVDMAFFETLMRDFGGYGSDSAEFQPW